MIGIIIGLILLLSSFFAGDKQGGVLFFGIVFIVGGAMTGC